ncbi:M56 family metallopeptidase [Zobellia galactanivorans]|uniref:BlaR1-type regulatory protein n=1 Tax=Zobellia galactanivorans (strain DSM 12802 / CCUG 47099 / CIP 106680 / NCIMB 13871 / Dsij) TaxID=63186 RepID=G0L5R7_ZOBGA|nr:M56 family metallopeptidase [Zobellia galactanivorans]CAZ96441.1 BlaR1-type regulatory protein [Zobellia galactanivorans]
MEVFLLKSSACLAIFMAFYKLLLETQPMHGFKRLYLAAALLLSFTIPSITFVEYVEAAPLTVETPKLQAHLAPATQTATSFDVAHILWALYILGVLVFSIRFLKNLGRILINIQNNPKLRMQTFINVLLQDATTPHTFFNYIFLNKQKFEAQEIPEEVLLHEATHAKQKHSLDILFVEVLQIILWFNPLIYIIKNWIKLNHEFLADRAVLNQGTPTPTYQNILLAFASSTNLKDNQSSLANAINYSSIKKRFTVMKKTSSRKSVVLRSVAVVPLITMLLFGFSEQITLPKETSAVQAYQSEAKKQEVKRYNALAKKYNAIPKETRNIALEDLKTLELIYGKMSKKQRNEAQPFPECQNNQTHNNGACAEEIAEYNALAKKYNKMLTKGKNIRILKTDVDRMAYLYAEMTTKQRASAQPFPELPEPPSPPAPPEETFIMPVNKTEVAAFEKRIEEIIENQEIYDEVSMIEHLNLHTGNITPNLVPNTFIQAPPNPPEPPSPLEHVRTLADKNAVFYLDEKEISYTKAIQLLEENKSINIDLRYGTDGRPKVKLSLNPIEINP